jgi:hypothetical protein
VNVTAADEQSVTLNLSRSELELINNALNEVCNGVFDLDHDGEFATRLGQTRDEARRLLAEVHAVFRPAT